MPLDTTLIAATIRPPILMVMSVTVLWGRARETGQGASLRCWMVLAHLGSILLRQDAGAPGHQRRCCEA